MKTSHKYLLFGISFGILFPAIALVSDTVFIKELSFSIENLLGVYRSSFLHLIISMAPIFLGASYYYAGLKAEKLKKNNESLIVNNERLIQMNTLLDEFNYQVTHDLKTSLIEVESLSIMLKKHANNESRRTELTHKLINSSKTGTVIIDQFTQKVDDIRDDFDDLNSNKSNNTTTSKEKGNLNLKLKQNTQVTLSVDS